MSTACTPSTDQRGFTLIEMLISTTIVVVTLGILFYCLAQSEEVLRRGLRQNEAHENVRQALGFMAPEIRQSGTTTSGSEIAVLMSGNQLSFKKNIGYSGGTITWSATITYTWSADGTIVRVGPYTDDVGASTVTSTIGSGIDSGFAFVLNGDGDKVTITIASTIDLNRDESYTHTVTQDIRLRN